MERVTKGHTRGGLKTYRRECYDEIGGVEHVDGWDTIDNVMARLYGWETSNFENILAAQARPTGVSVGLISTAFNEEKNHIFWVISFFVYSLGQHIGCYQSLISRE